MKNNQWKTSDPKDAATSKGSNAKAMGAIALAGDYNILNAACKDCLPASPAPAREAAITARKRPVGTGESKTGRLPASSAYRDSTGRIWAYRGKRGRVLALLATSRTGLTQWDTLPWHTRLGGTIHALRRDGLVIDTEREGEYRHARYWLRTTGCLIMQAETGPEMLSEGVVP